MYVNDPTELALLPEKEEVLNLAEPRDYHEFFHDDRPIPGNNYAQGRGIHTQICRFDSAGEHISMAEDCPHFEVEDEEGKRIRSGWTVQHSYGN